MLEHGSRGAAGHDLLASIFNVSQSRRWYVYRSQLSISEADVLAEGPHQSQNEASSLLRSIGGSSSTYSGERSGQSPPRFGANRSTSAPRGMGRRPNPGNAHATTGVQNLLVSHDRRQSRGGEGITNTYSPTSAASIAKSKLASDLSRQISRRFKAGDVYAPHDLSATEMAKWKKSQRPNYDAFDLLDINPMDEYKVRPTLPVTAVTAEWFGVQMLMYRVELLDYVRIHVDHG
jgi:hypothetical protein